MIITPFNRWEAWSTGKINLPKATQLVSGRARTPNSQPGSRVHTHSSSQKPQSKIRNYFPPISNKIKWTTATCNTDKSSKLYPEQNKTWVWVYLYEIIQKAKPVNNDRSYISDCLGPGIDHKEVQRKLLGVMGTFYILIVVSVTQVYISANTHWAVHFKWMQFIVCNLKL